MKKNNSSKKCFKEAGTKISLGTVLSSIILQSCSFDADWYNNKDNIYGNISLGTESKENLLDVNQLKLSQALIDYAKAITFIFEDITTNHDAAKAFCDNPNTYLANRFPQICDSDLKLELSDRDKRILMAMTDEQIQNAIKSKDFEAFISLCVQKGYFASAQEILTVNIGDLRTFFASEADFERYEEMLHRLNSDGATTRSNEIETIKSDFAIGAPVVAVGFVAIEIGGFADMAIKVHQYGAAMSSTMLASQNEPVMNLWYRENEETTDNDKIIFYDQLVNDRITSAMELILQTFPHLDKDEIYNYLTTMFKQYYEYE